MKRYLCVFILVAVGACFDLSNPGVQQVLVVAPVLDSLFVGDTLPARTTYLIDQNGQRADPGKVTWTINPSSVATIDSSGKIVGVSKGAALVIAQAGTTRPGAALVVVSRRLDVTLLMDTVVVMQGDTFTIPLAIKSKLPTPVPTVWFDRSNTPTSFTVDSATGLVRAVTGGTGGRYVVHVAQNTDTVADTGGVVVASLVDTTAVGYFFMTATGTAIRHEGGPAIALNYAQLRPGKFAFQVVGSATHLVGVGSDTVTIADSVVITLTDSVSGPATFDIDSISPTEATARIASLDPFCNPRRPWAYLNNIRPVPNFQAYSHGTSFDSIAGHIMITKYAPAAGGAIIGGRYNFRAQRTDLYLDPLGAETIRGTFVAPLRSRPNCQG